MGNDHQIIHSWQAPEFRHYPKNLAWYITLIIITVLIIAFQVTQKDLFGAVSIFILGIFVFLFARQQPQEVEIHLTNKGLIIDDSHIPYSAIQHFWIVNNENHRTLNIETTAYLNRTLVIELENQDPEHIRGILVQTVPEHPSTEETFAQRIMHRLKF
jgi:hypothetical protein